MGEGFCGDVLGGKGRKRVQGMRVKRYERQVGWVGRG
jgi:hypothetical protein